MSFQKNFIIKNGLEVNDNLIFADKLTNKVGIGTTNPTSKLHIDGAVNASDGFISVGSTTPVQITLVGNKLTFTAVGIGSTTLTLI